MKNNLEEIVKEKPSIKKRISGFIKRKALPWILAGALAVGFYGYRNISSPVSGSVRLTNAFRAESPTFSPDSKKLAYLEWEDTNRNGEWDDPDELYVCVKNTKSQKQTQEVPTNGILKSELVAILFFVLFVFLSTQ